MMSHRNMKWRELANDATAMCILLWSLHFLSYLTFIISTHRFYLFSSFHSHPTVHTTLQAQICPLSELRFNSHIPSVHALVWMNNALQFPLRGITNKCSETKKKKKDKRRACMCWESQPQASCQPSGNPSKAITALDPNNHFKRTWEIFTKFF